MSDREKRMRFRTPDRERETIVFELDGEEYHFTPSEMASVVIPALDPDGIESVGTMWGWIGRGLPNEEKERLEARLRDPDDAFDLEDLANIFIYLVGEAGTLPVFGQKPADVPEGVN